VNQFVKIYGSIIRSTVWQTAPHVKLTWVTMLILADSEGRVEGSIPGLANTAGVTIEQVEEALELFRQPDKYSRTKDHDGRRIQDIRGGWLVLNHNLYRDMRTETQQKEAARQQRYREKKKKTGKAPKRKAPAATPDEPAADSTVSRHVTPRDTRDMSHAADGKRHSSRVSRADPDPDPDPDLELIPNLESGSDRGRARPAPREQAAAPPAPLSKASPEYFGDVQPATCKVPSDYVELDRHRQSALELGTDVRVELERFRTHEYPRPYSDFHSRFDRWLLDARKFAETENFKRSQRKAPRAGVLLTQPNNGATGWETVDDDDDGPDSKAVGHA
jgi:hypothetical protein